MGKNQQKLGLYFLGTGGGRFVMSTQKRRTAGFRIVNNETQVHVDPGPGALVFSNWAGLPPSKLSGLIVTHCHPDHYTDAEVFIESMTLGTRKGKGILATTTSVLHGFEEVGPSISKYHQKLPEKIVELKKGTKFKIDKMQFKAIEARHSDPTSIGIRLKIPELGSFGYTSDTGYFSELPRYLEDLRLLVLGVIWPRNNPISKHLCTDDALNIIDEAAPRAVLLTHFGMRMLNANPSKEAAYLQEKTGIPVVALKDGMKISIEKNITIQGPRKNDEIITLEA
jgi:phosphoribosyl 1,2-cyclic phosphodiesterase